MMKSLTFHSTGTVQHDGGDPEILTQMKNLYNRLITSPHSLEKYDVICMREEAKNVLLHMKNNFFVREYAGFESMIDIEEDIMDAINENTPSEHDGIITVTMSYREDD